ncbi:MAG: DnaD domain protein [Clostridia bacterium]|nr:DnaD domain protein [Clostridia bacterium]
MAFCTYAKDNSSLGFTLIENTFLSDYLPVAPEGCLRVYLYARLAASHPEICASYDEMAQKLNLKKSELDEAFAYWERQGLVRRTSSVEGLFEILPVERRVSPEEEEYLTYSDLNRDLQSLFPADCTLRPQQYETARDWMDIGRIDQECVMTLIRWTLGRSKAAKPRPAEIFKTADRMFQKLLEYDVHTPEAILYRLTAMNGHGYEVAKEVLVQFGQTREPSIDEINLANKWLGEWKQDKKSVIAACAETAKASSPSFAYLDKVLENRVSGNDLRHAAVRECLEVLGANGNVTQAMLNTYANWQEQGFPRETILFAAERCALRGRNAFQSLTNMLAKWQAAGAFEAEAARNFVKEQEAAYAAKGSRGKAPAIDYTQRPIDRQYNDELVVDFDKLFEEGQQK